MKKLLLIILYIVITIPCNAQLLNDIVPKDLSLNTLQIGSTSYFDGNGYYIATGNATAWEDVLQFPIITGRFGGANNPSLATITGNIEGLQFEVNDYIYGSEEFIHSWKINTPISQHLHILTKSSDASNRFIQVEVTYAEADINGAMNTPIVVTANMMIPTSTPVNTHMYFEISNGIPSVNIVSGHRTFRIRRVTAVGTAPSVDPIFMTFGIHGYIDAFGSRQEYSK